MADNTVSEAKREAAEVKDLAQEEASKVKDQALDEARDIADEARERSRRLADQAGRRVRSEAERQAAVVASGARRLSGELRSMANRPEGPEGMATAALRGASEWIEGRLARYEQGGLEGVVKDVERFARQRPAAFLAGAAAAGVAVGRVLRNRPDGSSPSPDVDSPSNIAAAPAGAPDLPASSDPVVRPGGTE